MKKVLLVVILLFLLAGAIFIALFGTGEKEPGIITGTILFYSKEADLLTLKVGDTDVVSVDISGPDFVFTDSGNGNFLTLTDLRPGFTVEVDGLWEGKHTLLASKMNLLRVPNIIVHTPKEGETVSMPIAISGEARVFENTYNYRLLDQDGSVLAEGFGTANAPDVGKFGPFSFLLFYPEPKGDKGELLVFTHSAMDNSEIEKVSVPVVFDKKNFNKDKTTLAVYFSNIEKDPGANKCDETYPVVRTVPKTITPAREAINLLLAGPSETEKEDGYRTNLNTDTVLKKITIEGGVASVDFGPELMREVGGSCRVSAMRSQIENTLKQFPTVKEVIVTMNGKTEGVLEP